MFSRIMPINRLIATNILHISATDCQTLAGGMNMVEGGVVYGGLFRRVVWRWYVSWFQLGLDNDIAIFFD